jgi:hypothetical protein
MLSVVILWHYSEHHYDKCVLMLCVPMVVLLSFILVDVVDFSIFMWSAVVLRIILMDVWLLKDVIIDVRCYNVVILNVFIQCHNAECCDTECLF